VVARTPPEFELGLLVKELEPLADKMENEISDILKSCFYVGYRKTSRN
jgi:hypothetical protein